MTETARTGGGRATVATPLQAAFDRGEVPQPDERPPWLRERAWHLLTRHLRDRVPYAVLAREARVSAVAVRQLARRAAERLRHPELGPCPPPCAAPWSPAATPPAPPSTPRPTPTS